MIARYDDELGRLPVERAADGAAMEAGAMARLMDVLCASSVTFLARFPGPESGASCCADLMRHALDGVLLEPCDTTLISFGGGTMAVVLTPRSEQPLDPVYIHSLLEMFRRALYARLGLAPGAERGPALLPLTPVSSISALQDNIAALNELLEAIVHKQLRVQFQPIVHFASASVYGYEALIRVPQDGVLKRPGMFFNVADRARLVSWLDIACQEQCFEYAERARLREQIFINMDAEGLAHCDLAQHSLADRAAAFNIAPSRIVIEITERQTVEDYPRLVHDIEQLRSQGFKIAVDDAGAGYSSLHTITEIRPDFVKIDRSLMRNVQTNGTRRALVTTLAQYALQIGASVIAEGLETRDELATVIAAGVAYGQGYLLGKPNDGFKGLRREARTLLEDHVERRGNRIIGRAAPIEKIALNGVTVPPTTACGEIDRKFARNPDLESILVVDEDRIEGLVMRDEFALRFQALSADPQASEQPIACLMDRQPLVVEADATLEEVAHQATFRRPMRFHHDILVARGGRCVGVVPVRALLEAMTTRQVNRAKYVHPVTGLPGTPLIEQACNERLANGKPTIVLQARIAHFRAFNDHFGLPLGDEVLLATAGLLQQVQQEHGRPGDFVGHPGGNDFLLLLNPESVPALCDACVAQFGELAPQFYTPEQRRQRFLEITSAGGVPQRTPLMSLYFCGVDTRTQDVQHFRQVLPLLRSARRAAHAETLRIYIMGEPRG